jgi:hypothetical protein
MFSRQLPLEDGGLPLPVQREAWMATFHIYGDESGKMGVNVDRTSFCGYVGHVSQWGIFAQNWTNCRFKWQVPPIHMSRIMSPHTKDDAWKKVWQGWGNEWEVKRDDMLADFASIVLGSDIICVGAVVDCAHFVTLANSDQDFKKLHRNPIHMAIHQFVMRGLDRTEIVDKSSPVSIVLDDDPEYAMKCYEQLEGLKSTFQRVKERIAAISFVDDHAYPGVQAADMIAYVARDMMVKNIGNPDYISKLYSDLTFHGTHQPKYYNREILDALQAELRKDIADGKVVL